MLDATINTDDSRFQRGDKTQIVLRWLFPDPARPVLPLMSDFSIGRDPSCLMQLDGEGVSRVHAEVRRTADGFVLRDNGSTNGTHLGGRAIVEELIQPGAVLRVGSWVGVFELQAPDTLAVAPFDVAPGMLGGAALREAMEPARRAAASTLPIIVSGETGTGKEVASRTIHDWSGRRGEFCAINCAALPEHLVEGELFGYRKGAFTGAERNSPGHFRRAHLGTLLLDEITELPLATQAKLLRVLQERELVPLGESAPIAIDVRMIVAAHAPLGAAVAAAKFREDLYMRLRGLEITLPPLRARVADVPGLFQSFLAKHASGAPPALEPRLIESLCLYAWPGNVRELELVARRLLAVHGAEPVLKRRFLPEHVTEPVSASAAAAGPLDLERLAAALRRASGNLTKACAELQISRQRAYRLLDGVSVKDFLARNEEKP
ncbi:MAG TPA: sigma 54-interacting transcriptional regulator [Polyangiaceae bacterium]|nr:sigma 54-interacting transcriptional regulator [Polyangiaceae bacterium]